MSNTNKPLTAEQRRELHIKAMHVATIYNNRNNGRRVPESKAASIAVDFYIQQVEHATAELEGNYKCLLEDYTALTAKYAEDVSIDRDEVAALREELERSKERIDYYRDAADKKDAIILELEKERDGWQHNATTVSMGYHSLQKEIDELKFENDQIKPDLEEAVKQIKGWKELFDKTKAQRDEAVNLLEKWVKFSENLNEIHWQATRDFLSRLSSGETKPAGFEPGEQTIVPNLSPEQKNIVVTDCVEKASELLLRVFMFCDFKTHIETDILNEATGHKYHLSFTRKYEETKPTSPWISVEDRLPDVSNVIAARRTDVLECKFLDGRFTLFLYEGGLKAIPFEVTEITHWMPLPAPPESLTDKTEK